MTNDQTVTQALESCPFCGAGDVNPNGICSYSKGHEAWWADGTEIRESFFVSCVKCGISNRGMFGHRTRELAITAWNTRTAQSGDLASGLERAAQWHDARCKGPSVFEQELHETSAKALRHLAANPDATDMQALDAAHSGEGRSNGAGEDADGVFLSALEELDRECRCAAVRGEDGKRVGVAVLRKHFGPAMILSRDEFAPLTNSALRAQVAALSAPQGEVEREAFRPMSEWDQRNETVLLLVDYSDGGHPLDDATVAITIGHNNDHNIGPDEADGWKFAGWCWSHDHYVEGKGTPIGWMPLPHHLAALAQPEAGGE